MHLFIQLKFNWFNPPETNLLQHEPFKKFPYSASEESPRLDDPKWNPVARTLNQECSFLRHCSGGIPGQPGEKGPAPPRLVGDKSVARNSPGTCTGSSHSPDSLSAKHRLPRGIKHAESLSSSGIPKGVLPISFKACYLRPIFKQPPIRGVIGLLRQE